MQEKQNNNLPEEQMRALQAAINMRDELKHHERLAWRAVVFWVVLLVTVSLVFAAFTTSPIARIIGDPVFAYLAGVVLHSALGFVAHMWKIERVRGQPLSSVFGAFAISFILGLLTVAFVRAQLWQERLFATPSQASTAEQLRPYLFSLFLAVIEIGVPLAFGIKLAGSWLDYDFKKQELAFAEAFAHRMTTEDNKIRAWIHEAYSLKREIRQLERRIDNLKQTYIESRAQRKHDEMKAHKAMARRYDAEARLLEARLSLIERWYPGDPRDLQDESDRMLDEPRPPKDTADGQMPPADTDAPREVDKPKQPES